MNYCAGHSGQVANRHQNFCNRDSRLPRPQDALVEAYAGRLVQLRKLYCPGS